MNIIKRIEENCIRIDWKNPIDDTFFAMKESWPSLGHVFNDKSFQSLIENYNAASPEEYLQAIGQELSALGLLLYNINEDTDAYCLIVVNADESESFITEVEESEVEIELDLQKQPGKEIGVKAQRIKLAEGIPHEKISLKGSYSLGWPLTFTTQRYYNKNGSSSHELTFMVNLANWPPELLETKKITRLVYNNKNSIWAAIFADPETKHSKLKTSNDPLNDLSWAEVDFPGELHLLSKMFWINDDLIILNEKNAWLLESVHTGNLQCKFLYESQDRPQSIKDTFPGFIEASADKHYILLYSQFYEWTDKRLKPTGIYAEQHSDFGSFPTGDNRFVYVSNGRLTEIDIKNKRTRYRNLVNMDHRTRIKKFNDDWAVLLRVGYTNKDISIAQLWRPKTDEWKEIKLGSFGKFGIRDLLVIPNGNILMEGDQEMLIRAKNFDDVFSNPRYNLSNTNPWSENW